jgi:hypothetical protein
MLTVAQLLKKLGGRATAQQLVPAIHGGGVGSIPVQVMWDLWWAE